MHYRGAGGAYFNGTDPGVLLKWVWYEKRLNLARAFCRNIVRLQNRNDHIRFGPPLLRPFDGNRLILRVTLERTAVRPCRKSPDVCFSQLGSVAKIAVAGVREPRRHFLTQNRLLNGLSPWTSAVVTQE